MRTYRIELAAPSGFITPWQADTVFGHLCWGAERQGQFGNFKGAAGLTDLFRSNDPPFVISDGFPAGLLPAPITLKSHFAPESAENLDGTSYDLMKKAKKREFLTIAQFQAFQRGERPDLEDNAQGFIPATTLHNQISRITNTTGESGSLFELDEQFAPGDGTIELYARIREGFEDDLRLLFEIVAASGFGKKKSSGKGSFAVASFAPFDGFEGIANPTGYVSLSHFIPAQGDPTDGAYKTMVKYGKLGEEKTFCGNPFKKPLIMLKPGAVFRDSNPRPWYGRLVENIAYADSSVVHFAYTFPVPARIATV